MIGTRKKVATDRADGFKRTNAAGNHHSLFIVTASIILVVV